jgi:hypothetical protein
MPLWAFILLAVLCLGLIGLACACMTDQPSQQIDRALDAISAAPALVEVWTFGFGALAMVVGLDVWRRRPSKARSPALLQCFLF